MLWLINIPNNCLSKYFGDLCDMCAFNKYVLTSIYIFGSVSSFIDLVTIVVALV